MKRLSEIRAFEPTDTAVILVRRPSGGMAVIERAVYPPWLRSVLPAPERGTAFALWIQNPDRYFRSDASQHDDLLFETGLKRRVALGSLSVRPFRVTASQHIFELRLETGSSETQMPAES